MCVVAYPVGASAIVSDAAALTEFACYSQELPTQFALEFHVIISEIATTWLVLTLCLA